MSNNIYSQERYNYYSKAYDYVNQCKNLKQLYKKICKRKNDFPINAVVRVSPLSILPFDLEIIKKYLPFDDTDIEESEKDKY